MIQVIYLYGKSCESCQRQLPVIKTLAKRYYTDRVKFYLIDAEANPDKLADYNVSFIPSIVFRDSKTGQTLQKIDGADYATEGTIVDALVNLGEAPLSDVQINNIQTQLGLPINWSPNTWNTIFIVIGVLAITVTAYLGYRFRQKLFKK